MLRYCGLSATDARGRVLPARLVLRGATVLLRVDDSHASYPVTIDPLIQEGAKLTADDETGDGEFGFSAALSSDGDTALIGGPYDNNIVGAAWVFTRSGSTWTQQGPKLSANDESGEGFFGSSVALSSDGDTALIGGSGDNNGVGAAWVFTRSGSTWTQQGPKLTANDESGDADFGSVALSSDGNTALIGGGDDDQQAGSFVGAAWGFSVPLTLTSPADGGYTNDAQPSFSGTVSYAGPSVPVTVNMYSGSSASGTPVQTLTSEPGSDGSWSVQASAPLAQGTYTAQAQQAGPAEKLCSARRTRSRWIRRRRWCR